MDRDLEPEPASGAVEIRSTTEHKVGAGIFVLFLCGIGMVCWAGAVWPQLVESQPHGLPVRVFLFFFSAFPFGFGLFWSQVWFYRLRADAHGITESLGWKEKRVFWSDVASYSLELGQGQARYMEPVLFDAEGKMIFRPAGIARGEDPASVARRVEFCCFVQWHLKGKQALTNRRVEPAST